MSGARIRDGLRLLPSVVASRHLRALPYKVLLSLTDACNHRCRHCAVWTRRPGDELSPAELETALRSLRTLRWLDLTGGEITTRGDLDDVAAAVGAVRRRLVFLHFATNGWLPARAERFARRLARPDGPPLVVTVSVDGDAALHDHVRGRAGAFDRAVEAARRLHALPGVAVYLGTTLTLENGPHLDRLHAALREALPALADERWHINLMQRSPHFFGNVDHEVPDRDAAIAFTRAVERLRGAPRDPFAAVERLYLRALRWSLRRDAAPLPCQALRASVFVGPTGDVHPCHVRAEPLGNLRDFGGDLAALLRAPAARAARGALTRRGCDGCWTPCEAYHAILAAPGLAVLRALSGAAR